MLLASLARLQCIITGVGAREGGHLNAEENGSAPSEHPATDNLATDAKTTTHHFVLLRGDPRLVELKAGYIVVDQILDCCIAQ
jgi:hypothetical protein